MLSSNIRWIMAGIGLVVIAWLGWLMGPDTPAAASSPAWQAAHTKWKSQAIQQYHIKLQITTIPDNHVYNTIRITVQDGRVRFYECWAMGTCGYLPYQRDQLPIEDLFRLARVGFDHEAALVAGCVDVAYHPVYGFPQTITNDRCHTTSLPFSKYQLTVLEFTTQVEERFAPLPSEPLPLNIESRWLHGIPCRVPCYEGMTPGVTTVAEALAILRRNPLVDHVIVVRSKGNNEGTITWQWGKSNLSSSLKFGIGGTEVIQSMTPTQPKGWTLGMVIAAVGAPSDVVIFNECIGKPARRSYKIELLHRPQGLYMRGALEDSPHIEALLPVEGFQIYNPALDWLASDDQSRYLNNMQVTAWQGYQDVATSSAIDPTTTCP